ncbi:FadR/GntR family transcriptional regulator [uncultured Modestobacter sp.]|uniref:FadR/GntR family transcriptional regulator n=1 Tax=uncultured Modestobacter sp. TaxID=380048 RepID=UPI0026046FC4|nr:FCD domain-containing protein [uncultured Modestobacter sp.]
MSAAEPAAFPRSTPTPIGHELRVPKMAELVAARLRGQIIRGELAEGESLPPEAALLAQFGVSRPTLREAFRVLEAESLIIVRRGARGGARVQLPSAEVAARYAGLILQHRGTTLADVYLARIVIEPQAVGLLARRRSDDDVRELREALAVGAEPGETRLQTLARHEQFHTLLVALTGNQTLPLLMGMIEHIFTLGNWSVVQSDPNSPDLAAASRRGLRAHREVVDLIEVGDDVAAEKLWRRHLTAAQEYLVHGNATTVLDLLG